MYNNQLNNGVKLKSSTPQNIFDNFNKFILSDDLKVFGKLVARTNLYNEIKDVPGDIVECGVYKGTGLFTWLKLKQIYSTLSNRKVIGFDVFDSYRLLSKLEGTDFDTMSDLFNERNFEYKNYKSKLINDLESSGFNQNDFELIEGDISETAYSFAKERPGFRIALLYLDLDIEKPTYDALNAFWSKVSKGGIVVFDEYACHQWTESDGVDKFLQENNLQLKMLNYSAPTAYIKK